MKVKFVTLGCKVNQYEAQSIMEDFSLRKHNITNSKADLYVINTCTVTHRADAKSKEAVKRAKKENPNARIAVSGCLIKGNEDYLNSLGVDYIIPQDKKQYLADIILGKPCRENLKGDNTSGRIVKDIWALKISSFINKRAFVKIQDGCSNHCSFCKIPFVRGKSLSRKPEDVVDEVKKLSHAYPEIIICGINIGLYGKDFNPPRSLASLIKKVIAVKTLKRLRLSSIEPALVDEELLSFLNNPKFCPHFHFPFQSADDFVLKEMNKRATRSLYESVVRRVRSIAPKAAISCDIMVGFPHEDKIRFLNTVDFLTGIKPMRMHIFRFSPREYTSYQKTTQKNEAEIRERMSRLREINNIFSKEYAQSFKGSTLYAVTEQHAGKFTCGYTQNYIKVYINKHIPLGKITAVKITKTGENKVFGENV
ncbi:MAG: tRNA (N(6)-L-threonylcarbamoyladenosine(37)-C(2))-methylthiotransferase MtaB [Candidatus Omnitrophota bacterium]